MALNSISRESPDNNPDISHIDFAIPRFEPRFEPSAEENTSEIRLTRPIEISPITKSDAINLLNSLCGPSLQKEGAYFEKRSRFFKELHDAISEKSSKNTPSKPANTTHFTSEGKNFTYIESELVYLFSLSISKPDEKKIADSLTKIKSAFIQSGANNQINSEDVNKYFPDAKGLFTAVQYFNLLYHKKLPPGFKNKIYMNPELDNTAAVDFVEIVYSKNTDDDISIKELNLIQVKSSPPTQIQTSKILEKHRQLIEAILSNPDLFTAKYYPTEPFLNYEDANIQLIDIQTNILDIVRQSMEKKANSFKLLMEQIEKIIKTKPKLSPGGKTRYLARQLFYIIKFSVDFPTEMQDGHAQMLQLIESEISLKDKNFIEIMRQEFNRQLKYLEVHNAETSMLVRESLEKIIGPISNQPTVAEPHLSPILQINSIIATGTKELLRTSFPTSTANPKYLIARHI